MIRGGLEARALSKFLQDRVKNEPWFYTLWFILVAQIFVVQEITLCALNSQRPSSVIIDRAIRLLLDVLVCGVGISVIPWMMLPAAFLVLAVFQFSILVYHLHFARPLSVRVIESASSEGMSVADAAWEILGTGNYIIIGLFLLNLAIAFAAKPKIRMRFAMVCLAIYLTTILTANFTHKPFKKLRTFDSVAGVGLVYGYVPTWIAEMLLYNEQDLLNHALARGKKETDILTPIAPPLSIPNKVVFIQLESFDYALIDFKIKGQEVTPNLNHLKNQSQAYAVKAKKVIGSCDSDFTAMMGRLPSDEVTTYKLEEYPFQESIISQLKHRGYKTSVFHGVSGEFFNRRPAFEKMGFDQIFFREEVVNDGTPADGWAVDDKPLMDFAANNFDQSKKEFQFIITVTSHIPFHHMPEEAHIFFPGSNEYAENYFDAVHYTDEALGEYVKQLPKGTLVVMYGDHMSAIKNPQIGYEPEFDSRVPFFIHRVGDSSMARNSSILPRGDLTLLDAINYVHHWILKVPVISPT